MQLAAWCQCSTSPIMQQAWGQRLLQSSHLPPDLPAVKKSFQCPAQMQGAAQAQHEAQECCTSVKSSMLVGLMSSTLKDCDGVLRCHRLMRRSSALRKVSWSLDRLTLLMWYVCALLYTRLHFAASTVSVPVTCSTARHQQRQAATAAGRCICRSDMLLPTALQHAAASAASALSKPVWRLTAGNDVPMSCPAYRLDRATLCRCSPEPCSMAGSVQKSHTWGKCSACGERPLCRPGPSLPLGLLPSHRAAGDGLLLNLQSAAVMTLLSCL